MESVGGSVCDGGVVDTGTRDLFPAEIVEKEWSGGREECVGAMSGAVGEWGSFSIARRQGTRRSGRRL